MVMFYSKLSSELTFENLYPEAWMQALGLAADILKSQSYGHVLQKIE